MIEQLFPFPGSKASSKYDSLLYPRLTDTAMCEPFMGSAARSLRYRHLDVYLGEINPGQRAIAQCLQDHISYETGWFCAFYDFWDGWNNRVDELLDFAGLKESQKAVKQELPDLYKGLTRNWKRLCKTLFFKMQCTDKILAGYYAFCIRACFGNVMRLNPRGTQFNVSWHVDKLEQACKHSPTKFIRELQAIKWNPTVFDSWQGAIAGVPDPANTFLLLDPPYVCDNATEKMTPCYVGHRVTTSDGMAETFKLTIESLQAGIDRGFTRIALCNYYVDELDRAVQEICQESGYSAQRFEMGECNALGNSNGRLKHGKRADQRKRPVEMIWMVEKVRSRIYFEPAKPHKIDQLNLLEATP